MHVIAISNQKGGCGKTTTAINLAASFASLGKKTLIIDLDPQAHATYGLGIRDEKVHTSMYNVLTEQSERKKQFIEDVVIPVEDNLDCAPAHILLSTIEQEFTNKEESVSKLSDILQSMSFPYEYVVIDCPPSLGFLTFNALRAAHTVLVPIELSSFALMGVDKLLSMIELIRVKLKHVPNVFALATMVDMRTKLSQHMADSIKESFGEHTLQSMIHQTITIKESQAKGVSAIHYSERSKAASDYMAVCQEIIKRISGESQEMPQSSAQDAETSGNFIQDFTLNMAGAKDVYIVGDFNNWSISDDSRLWQKEEGVWQKRLPLGRGRYRYKFVIDGEWSVDPDNDQIAPNPYGGLDSVVEVQ